MKKHLVFLLLLPFFWTCQKEPPYLSLTPAFYEAPIGGGTVSIMVESNFEVSYTIDEKGKSWIQGPGGSFREGEVRFTVSANDIYEARSSQIVFKTSDGSVSKTFTVSQNGENDILLEEHSYHIDGNAQTLTIKAKSNVPFKATPQSDWITSATSRGLVESQMTFAIAANDSFTPREGTILLEWEDIKRTVRVLQDEKEAVVIDPEYVSRGDGGTLEIPFTTNTQANLELESGKDWITYTETRSATRKTLVFSLSENNTGALRSAVLTFRNSEGAVLAESKIIQLISGRGIVFTIHGNSWEAPFVVGSNLYWLTEWGDGYWSPSNTQEMHSFKDSGSHTVRVHEHGATGFSMSVKGLDAVDLSNM